jgi:hypothetical protein
MPPVKISHDQIRDAVRRSGYLLEYRIEQVLGRYGYMVEANQAYPDPITGKSRELDISAIRPEFITSDYRNMIWPRLLIECINNPQPIGFFTKNPGAPTAHIYDLKFSGLPVKVKVGKHWKKLSDFLDMEQYHHHCKGRIATQYRLRMDHFELTPARHDIFRTEILWVRPDLLNCARGFPERGCACGKFVRPPQCSEQRVRVGQDACKA